LAAEARIAGNAPNSHAPCRGRDDRRGLAGGCDDEAVRRRRDCAGVGAERAVRAFHPVRALAAVGPIDPVRAVHAERAVYPVCALDAIGALDAVCAFDAIGALRTVCPVRALDLVGAVGDGRGLDVQRLGFANGHGELRRSGLGRVAVRHGLERLRLGRRQRRRERRVCAREGEGARGGAGPPLALRAPPSPAGPERARVP
jgi:hypothetical protein